MSRLTAAQALDIVRGPGGLDEVGADPMEVAPACDVGEVPARAGTTPALGFLCLSALAPAPAAGGGRRSSPRPRVPPQ